ncbi:hypothetical protein IG631_14975 [Alternaria alternata]|nr:hypothetical protein IG631_14975 [Alternaria alternata]
MTGGMRMNAEFLHHLDMHLRTVRSTTGDSAWRSARRNFFRDSRMSGEPAVHHSFNLHLSAGAPQHHPKPCTHDVMWRKTSG